MKKEFKVGDTVTLDRYNHIDDVQKVKIVGFGEMPISKTLTYKMDVNGTIIDSTGVSIMESKYYKPVADEDRHCKMGVFVAPNEQPECEHEWKCDTFDCYGFPTEQYCEKCGKNETI